MSVEINDKIKKWLKDPQDYREGLGLFGKVTKKGQLLGRLLRGESTSNKFKLLHELKNYIKINESANSKSIKPADPEDKPEVLEDIATMENLNIIEKIQKWFAGPRDYKQGREVLKIVPGEDLHYLQLTHIETYESKVRLGFWLKNALKYMEDDKTNDETE
jgi:hypothetical protein